MNTEENITSSEAQQEGEREEIHENPLAQTEDATADVLESNTAGAAQIDQAAPVDQNTAEESDE